MSRFNCSFRPILQASRTGSFGLAFFCLALFCLNPATTAATSAESLPPDVAKYIERRNTCDHWRGEEGDDKARQAEIKRGQCRSCPGSDSGLAELNKKYETNKVVQARLAQFEDRIEPTAKEWKKICSSVSVDPALPKK